MKYLFVGGPLDGGRHETDGRPHWRVYVPSSIFIDEMHVTNSHSILSNEHVYNKRNFSSSCKAIHSIYFHSSLDDCDAMGKLIEGYRQSSRESVWH